MNLDFQKFGHGFADIPDTIQPKTSGAFARLRFLDPIYRFYGVAFWLVAGSWFGKTILDYHPGSELPPMRRRGSVRVRLSSEAVLCVPTESRKVDPETARRVAAKYSPWSNGSYLWAYDHPDAAHIQIVPTSVLDGLRHDVENAGGRLRMVATSRGMPLWADKKQIGRFSHLAVGLWACTIAIAGTFFLNAEMKWGQIQSTLDEKRAALSSVNALSDATWRHVLQDHVNKPSWSETIALLAYQLPETTVVSEIGFSNAGLLVVAQSTELDAALMAFSRVATGQAISTGPMARLNDGSYRLEIILPRNPVAADSIEGDRN